MCNVTLSFCAGDVGLGLYSWVDNSIEMYHESSAPLVLFTSIDPQFHEAQMGNSGSGAWHLPWIFAASSD